MLYSISRFIFFVLLQLFCGIEIKGKERIPSQGGFILASNHVSYLDPIVLGIACPRKMNYMAKDTLFRNPLLAWWLGAVGVFPVRRDSADYSALKQSLFRLRKGKGLLIFPEGTRQVRGILGVAQPGVGFLAARTNLPVIPSFIKGTDAVLPKGSRFIRPRKISVCFGQEIVIERRESPDYQEIADKIMLSIGHLACR